MKNFKLKKNTAIIVAFTSMMVLTACGSSNAGSEASNQNNSDVIVKETETATEENGTKQETDRTSTDVSMEGLLSHVETPAENFTYYILDEQVHIDGYVGTDPVVVIPEFIEGYPVKTVSNIKGKGIQAIKFSDSMEGIGGSLFMSDEDIQYVVFGANIKGVGDYAFMLTSNMKGIQLVSAD